MDVSIENTKTLLWAQCIVYSGSLVSDVVIVVGLVLFNTAVSKISLANGLICCLILKQSMCPDM